MAEVDVAVVGQDAAVPLFVLPPKNGPSALDKSYVAEAGFARLRTQAWFFRVSA
jgi:hypothetical protein